MHTINLNIANLISLWKNATQVYSTYNEDENLGYCFIPKSEWPNKAWLNKEIDSELINEITQLLHTVEDQLTLSYFDFNKAVNNVRFESYGLYESSIQYGMSLGLKDKFKINKELDLRLVVNSEDCIKWSESFQDAFGYNISKNTLEKTCHNINYYLIYDNEDLVGTIISHLTQSTIGIHSLGILPSMRGKGYATQIMHKILNKGLEQDCNLATLQASKMAKSMYERMGFVTEFIMRNYKLKK